MFIFTMAGLSSRFFKAGYSVPKYQLSLNGESVFFHSVNSFHKYFKTDKFIFVIRNIFDTYKFVKDEVEKLGISDYSIVILDKETRGQAETAYLALKEIDNITEEPIYIFNIDTIRYDYTKPEFINECDGYLEVFIGEGEHWSFISPGINNSVIKTTEKERISDLCSDGLYFFKNKNIFEETYYQCIKNNDFIKGEIYIAPLYNYLIRIGKNIKYYCIGQNEIDFCGTPDEYTYLLNKLGK